LIFLETDEGYRDGIGRPGNVRHQLGLVTRGRKAHGLASGADH